MAEDMAAALLAVLDLHRRTVDPAEATDEHPAPEFCSDCNADWPCPTVQAIQREMKEGR